MSNLFDTNDDETTPPVNVNDLMVTKDDLARAADQKRQIALMGAVGDNLSNRSSFGNMFLGRQNPHQDLSGITKNLMDQADAPVAQKQTLMAQEMKKPELEQLIALRDPTSDSSKMVKGVAMGNLQIIKDSGVIRDPQVMASITNAFSNGNGAQVQAAMEKSKPFLEMAQAAIAQKRADSQAKIAQSKEAAMLAALSARSGLKEQQFGERTANNDKEMVANQLRLNGIGRIKDLMQAAADGKIKNTGQLKSLYAEEMARLELGAGALGLGMAERNDVMPTIKSEFAKAAEKFSGKPQDAITPDQLKQANGVIGEMGKSYMAQFDQRHNLLRRGATQVERDVIDQKFNGMRDDYRKRLGYWNSFDNQGEGSGVPGISSASAASNAPASGLTSDDLQALAWAKSNPGNIKAQKILMKLNQKVKGAQ